MKISYRDSNPGKSTIHFLPMNDMKATDYSCIYSTMLFVQKLGRIYSKDIVLTFDQSLYWKAMEIKTHKSKNGNFKDMVLILGAFHSCMSFLRINSSPDGWKWFAINSRTDLCRAYCS